MDISSFLNKKFHCEYCGKIHEIKIRFIEKADTEKLPEIIKKFYEEKKIIILCDNITYQVAGEKIHYLLKKQMDTDCVILKPIDEKRVTAKEEYLPLIEENAKGKELIITVGTGTITDLGKIVGDKLNIPVLCFPTAPSMNGYTSPVAAYIKEGVKFTIPVKCADGVFMDMEIIKNSPLELIKAGFADSLAKSFANADWKISSIITGEVFCSLPYKIVSQEESKYIDKGELLLERDRETISTLMNGLNLGGISMIIAGKSSPASGGEHLISHFLDMYAHQYGRETFSYHGIQVASGIYISSLLYDEIKVLNSNDIKKMIESTKIDYSSKYEKLINYFPAGKSIIEEEFKWKMKNLKILREKLPEKWNEIKENVYKMVIPSEKIKTAFIKAKIPFLLSEIGVDENLIFDDITLSRFIRNRIVILDIADEIGMLEKFPEKYLGK